MSDVTNPGHYTDLTPEPIDVIEALGLNYHLGCAVKYIARYTRKGNPAADLRKAAWYVDRSKDHYERAHLEPLCKAVVAQWATPDPVADVLLRCMLGTVTAADAAALRDAAQGQMPAALSNKLASAGE